MWFSTLMEEIFREMLFRGVGGKTYVVPPKIAVFHDPRFPWRGSW